MAVIDGDSPTDNYLPNALTTSVRESSYHIGDAVLMLLNQAEQV